MVNDVKPFIRITLDKSNDIGVFLVERFEYIGYAGDGESFEKGIGRFDGEVALRKPEGDTCLYGRNYFWTFQEGAFESKMQVIRRTEVIEHQSFIFSEEPITVGIEEEPELYDNKYLEPEHDLFSDLKPEYNTRDAIFSALLERGKMDPIGIACYIYSNHNKSVGPDRVRETIKRLINEGLVVSDEKGMWELVTWPESKKAEVDGVIKMTERCTCWSPNTLKKAIEAGDIMSYTHVASCPAKCYITNCCKSAYRIDKNHITDVATGEKTTRDFPICHPHG